ncbi:MAG: ATP-binding protein [Chloroflexi bacterium]|nr:ATP-binding protein [Chloroflexota bacterium]
MTIDTTRTPTTSALPSLNGVRGAALVRTYALRARTLSLFRGVLADEIGAAFLDLLDALAAEADVARVGSAYARLFGLLADEAETYPEPLVGDAWQNHLLDRLLADDNPFSRKAQWAGTEGMGASLLEQTRRDLAALQVLFGLDTTRLSRAAANVADAEPMAPWVTWDRFSPSADGPPIHGAAGRALKAQLAATSDWSTLTTGLAAYFRQVGAGPFGRFRAFRWARDGGEGRLVGIIAPDPIQLDQLIGYEQERELVVQNTEQFLAGYPANSVLLYGDRGTGKSSTVKALLNEHAERGLRLIEVARDDLADFPRIINLLRDRPERFILFVDDLSFEEHERDYRGLKAVLEGSIEARPANVVLYATSNRRHLVQERWTDRESTLNAEIHGQDTMQEKLSLSDRFGIRVVFLAPDQRRYLDVVEALARQRRLAIEPETLRRRAIQWADWHNGRSGRTARQFVDHLEGELGMADSQGHSA